eukprot:TRINITY_DN5947_c0_g1_i1.p1 TRINITY_DN5947_c0_g1~~TRINITY_DN5947_c0_g1_i1.p1  ORF type:complete len:231 (+),score=81.35 TRINITY_DN5947_c0_g1_i1:61-693(+)
MVFVIGIAGGTASGKTSVCKEIETELDNQRVVVVSLDSFYRNLTEDELQNVANHNFDHPDAFDWEILNGILAKLKRGETVEIPIYDFVTHSRLSKVSVLSDYDVVLFEGILAFYQKEHRDLMDLKVFVDTDADTRLARRVKRDLQERGRDLDGVLLQYLTTVKPAFDTFVQPTMKFADVIIPRGVENRVAVDLIVKHVGITLRTLKNGRK